MNALRGVFSCCNFCITVCMIKLPYLLPLLVITTLIHVLGILFSVFGSVLLTFDFSLMFQDSPGTQLAFPWWMAILVMVLTTFLPVIIVVSQWIFYKKAWFKTSLGIALVGLLPTLGAVSKLFTN